MYLYQKASTFCVKSVKMPLVRVKPIKIPDFCVNSVKIYTGQKFTQICLWGLTNIRYIKDNPGNSSSLPSPSLVE